MPTTFPVRPTAAIPSGTDLDPLFVLPKHRHGRPRLVVHKDHGRRPGILGEETLLGKRAPASQYQHAVAANHGRLECGVGGTPARTTLGDRSIDVHELGQHAFMRGGGYR